MNVFMISLTNYSYHQVIRGIDIYNMVLKWFLFLQDIGETKQEKLLTMK